MPFLNEIKGEEYFNVRKDEAKLLKQDLLGDYNKIANLPGVTSFNSGDKGTSSNYNQQSKTKLIKPVTLVHNVANLTQILGDVETSIQAPSQDVIDKINFIFNSMSKNNIADKSNDLKSILTNDNVIKWFSNFLILNRISVEYNNHQIYYELITYIDSKELNNLLIKDSISFIRKLLLSETIAKDAKEKKVLINLGSWLGIMTLAKNKPILARDLDLKEIIFDAYENGKLTAIIPFICKILEHSAKTKVFHSKNPWIQAILAVLAELYYKQNLKQTLKFEIENIFKKLDIDLNSFTQSRLLDAIVIISTSQDFSRPITTSEPEFDPNELLKIITKQEQYQTEALMFLNRTHPNLMTRNELINIITNALFMAINEILAPVVERAVNISQVTTRELILKDFAFEKDESKFKNAANLCIKSLAGSLAMVTCKEPLRIGFNNQLKDILGKKGLEAELVEALNNTVNNSDILEIGSSYIQNYVIKRAIDKIEKDKVIIDELEKRKKTKTLDIRPDFILKIKSLPDILRPNVSGLTSDQLKIYEDFERVTDKSGINTSSQSSKIGLLKKLIPALKEVLDSPPTPKIINKYEICMLNIQFITKSDNTEYIEEDDQLSILSKMISESKVNDASIVNELVNVSFKYIVAASKANNLSLININSEILKGWLKIDPSLPKEITHKLLNTDDLSIRFRFDIHYYFFVKNIFDMNEYENFISDYLEENSMNETVRRLISDLIDKKVLSVASFKKIPSYMIDNAVSADFFDLFAKKSSFCQTNQNFFIIDSKICNIRDYNSYINFRENCKFVYKLLLNFVYQTSEQENVRLKLKEFVESSIVKVEEQMNVFIMIITELAVKSVLFYDTENYYYPECEAKCIMCLLNIIPSTTTNKLKLFENILLAIFKVFHYDYTKNLNNFNQKPYHKLLVNIVYLLHIADNSEEMFNGYKKLQYFFVFSEVLRFMKPHNYPGFVLGWMDIVSCKYFNSIFLGLDPAAKTLKENVPKFEKYLLILIDLLSYLKALNSEIMADYNSKIFVDTVYKFFFLLSTSYPEFLSYYYYIIIASLPAGDNFLQLKNIILYSTPADIEQPDPFFEEFKVDSLPDIRKNAAVLFDINSILYDYGYKGIMEEFVETKNESLLDELINKLNKNDKDQVQNYLSNHINK